MSITLSSEYSIPGYESASVDQIPQEQKNAINTALQSQRYPIVLAGTTGAGKTTISRILLRFYEPISGQLLVNGVDVQKATQKSLRELIGVVPQDAPLFNDTLKFNIGYGRRDATFEEIEQAAKEAQILPFIEAQTNGWDTVVGERGLKLSGGEKQRVAIARCLLKNPDILVLDEATSALDTVTENSIQQALAGLSRNRTVLVIAHRLGTIKAADQICVLGEGKVSQKGTHAELMEQGGKYRELWDMQLASVGVDGEEEAGKGIFGGRFGA